MTDAEQCPWVTVPDLGGCSGPFVALHYNEPWHAKPTAEYCDQRPSDQRPSDQTDTRFLPMMGDTPCL